MMEPWQIESMLLALHNIAKTLGWIVSWLVFIGIAIVFAGTKEDK